MTIPADTIIREGVLRMADPYIIEIALTHDHEGGNRLPDYIQALCVPLADAEDVGFKVAEKVGDPVWDDAVPLTPPVLFDIIEQDTGLDVFLEKIGNGPLTAMQPPERIEFSLEGEDDCMICVGLREVELIGQGRMH